MTAVCLGIDPQKSRLGLALVTFEAPHRALWADTVSIDEPDAGWRHEQIRQALGDVDIGVHGEWLTDAGIYRRTITNEITRVGIEQPALIGDRPGIFDAGGVFHLVLAEAHRRWPWAPQVVRQPSQWKRDALGKGNASKAEILAWARAQLGEGIGQDAADALGVAISAAKLELVEAA